MKNTIFVPFDRHDDVLYQPPTESERKILKEEKEECWNLSNSKKHKMLMEAELLKIEKWQEMDKRIKIL